MQDDHELDKHCIAFMNLGVNGGESQLEHDILTDTVNFIGSQQSQEAMYKVHFSSDHLVK